MDNIGSIIDARSEISGPTLKDLREIRKLRRSTKQKVIFPEVVLDTLDVIHGSQPHYSPGWNSSASVYEAHRLYFDAKVRQIKDKYASHSYSSSRKGVRGIVTLGGGEKYYPGAYALCYLLRKLGCQLPIECWYLNDGEMDPRMEVALRALNVEPKNCMDHIRERPRCFGGWEAKVWAITYSSFDEVLYLDADQVPVKDPSYLFDEPRYREIGSWFWPDYKNELGWDITARAFQVLGLDVPGNTARPDLPQPTDYEPFESGQMLLNKSMCWGPLELCRLFNDHSDFFFPRPRGRNWYFYGDKSTFYLAWNALKHPYILSPETSWGGMSGNGAFMQKDLQGNLIFQHKCQPPEKLNLYEKVLKHPDLVNLEILDEAMADLRLKWTGEIRHYTRQLITPQELLGKYRTEENTTITFKEDGVTELGTWGINEQGQLVVQNQSGIRLYVQDKNNVWVRHLASGAILYLAPAPPDWFQVSPTDKFGLGVWLEVHQQNEYKQPEQYPPGTLVLDIGGHVGSFVVSAILRGAEKVITYEPDRDNFTYLLHNVGRYNDQVVLHNMAVGEYLSPQRSVQLYRPPGAEHTGGGSTTRSDGKSVSSVTSVGFRSVLAQLPDQITLMKLDCEGGEWPILETYPKKLSDRIANICGEYHLSGTGYTEGDLSALLFRHGYKYKIHNHIPGLGWFWAWRDQPIFNLD